MKWKSKNFKCIRCEREQYTNVHCYNCGGKNFESIKGGGDLVDPKLTINNDELKISKVEPIPPTFTFKGNDGMEILRLEPNGDIYVRGKLAENDKQITDGMRDFLLSHGY